MAAGSTTTETRAASTATLITAYEIEYRIGSGKTSSTAMHSATVSAEKITVWPAVRRVVASASAVDLPAVSSSRYRVRTKRL